MKLLYLFLLFGTACVPKPPIPPAPPQPEAGALTCMDACRRLQELGCPAGKPTPRGSTCADVCENVQQSGIVSWDLTCLANATSCELANRCP